MHAYRIKLNALHRLIQPARPILLLWRLLGILIFILISYSANAGNTVARSDYFGGPGSVCYQRSSPTEVETCTVVHYEQELAQSLLVVNVTTPTGYVFYNAPVSCRLPALYELGNIYGSQNPFFVGAFQVNRYYAAVNGSYAGCIGETLYFAIGGNCPINSSPNYSGSCDCAAPYASNITGTMCVLPSICPAGQKPHPYGGCMLDCSTQLETHPNLHNTACVPNDSCPINDLLPLTSDALGFEANTNLSDTKHLDSTMYSALLCLLRDAKTGTPTVGSAYRPPSYNQHLIDVFNNWKTDLSKNENPLCTARKIEAQKHFNAHQLILTQPPIPSSRHTRGLAIDVTINLPAANIDAIAKGCGLVRPLPVKNRVHFQFP